MTRRCPNCGDPTDLLVPPPKDPPTDLVDYDKMCHIGTSSGGELGGVRVYHNPTYE